MSDENKLVIGIVKFHTPNLMDEDAFETYANPSDYEKKYSINHKFDVDLICDIEVDDCDFGYIILKHSPVTIDDMRKWKQLAEKRVPEVLEWTMKSNKKMYGDYIL